MLASERRGLFCNEQDLFAAFKDVSWFSAALSRGRAEEQRIIVKVNCHERNKTATHS